MSNFNPESKYTSFRDNVVGYTSFTVVRGQVVLHSPPEVSPEELRPVDAERFGMALKIARLNLLRASSHSVADIDKIPTLQEIDRLQAVFPAPPTRLEQDLRYVSDIVRSVGRVLFPETNL